MDISLEIFENSISNYIYQSRLSDVSGNPVLDDQGNMAYKYQQSKAQIFGGEATLNLHPELFKWLNLNNSIAYVKGLNKK